MNHLSTHTHNSNMFCQKLKPKPYIGNIASTMYIDIHL